jgi:signal transduction histidine kinase
MLLDGATRLHGLIEKVLTLAELKAGTRRLHMVADDLATVVRCAVDAMAPRAVERGITIAHAPASPQPALLDRGEMTSALAAILDNAVRVSPSGAVVEVGLARAADHVRVTISDQGPGIPARLVPRLFEELAAADVGHVDGQGLSLAIARRLIEAHGGTIAARSGPVGGATFTVELPLATAARPAATATEAST